MTARIGALRHRLTIETPGRTDDGGGGAGVAWSTFTEVWAAIVPRRGREIVAADRVSGEITHDVWLRYRDDVTPAMRFRLGTRIFDILAVINDAERGLRLRCPCRESDL